MNIVSTTSRILLTLTLVSVSLGITHSAVAQTKVALIDVGYLFKNHPRFSQELDSLKKQADQLKVTAQGAQEAFAIKRRELQEYKPSSPQFKDLYSKLAQEEAAFTVEQNALLSDLVTQEAKLHFDTYQELQKVIDTYCTQRNIQLVLRFNSDPLDGTEPQSIMDKVNGSVVYFEPQKNVTESILQMVRQSSANAGNPSLK